MTENARFGSANVQQAAQALKILVENALTGGAAEHQLLIDELSRLLTEDYHFVRRLRACLSNKSDQVQIEIWSSSENVGPTAVINRIQLVGTSSERLISASSKSVWRNANGHAETSAGFVLTSPSAFRVQFDELFLLTESLFRERALLNSSQYNCKQAA